MFGLHRITLPAALLACLSAHAVAAEIAPPQEPTRLTVTFGTNSDVSVYGAGAQWPLVAASARLSRFGLEGAVGADLLYWHGNEKSHVWDASITPYLRWRPADPGWQRLFVQAGVGVHLLSQTSINESRRFGTAFQIGSRAGVGFNFGTDRRYEAMLFVQHVSNARIKQPNDGLTYFGVALGMAMQ